LFGVAISAKRLYDQMFTKTVDTHALDTTNALQPTRRVCKQIDYCAAAAFMA
jgi:hypothetical protein